jgi:DNA ligase-1
MINQLFETLASDNGRKFKEDLLSQHKDNNTLKRVVELALNPLTNFYIRKIPAYAPRLDGGTRGLSWALNELNALASREVTGHAAIEHLTMILENVSADDGEVIKKIIQKDLRCGVSEATANKIWKGLIPEFPYMRCCLPKHTKMDKFDWKNGVFSQLKADGMFANVNLYDDGAVELFSRSGSVFPMEQFKGLAEEIAITLVRGTQTHGEVLVYRDGEILPREIGNGILNSVLKGGEFADNEQPFLLVWDQIPLSEATPGNKYKVGYAKRFEYLRKQLHDDNSPRLIQMIPTKIVYSIEEAHDHYAEMLAEGFEGTIIKDRNAIWEDTTSKHQVKYKLDVDVDLKITGFTAGNGKNAELFGSITCESADGQLVVNVSGFKDKKQAGVMTRAEIWEMREDLIGTVMTVKSNNIMKPTKSNLNYSLFLPRFVEFRQDKTEADTLAKVIEQFENAVK